LTIDLTAEEEARLRERAMRLGQAPEDLARAMIASGLTLSESFAELLDPFRRQVEASGTSDADLDALFEQAREEARSDRLGRTG
jgi:hypothetical protein